MFLFLDYKSFIWRARDVGVMCDLHGYIQQGVGLYGGIAEYGLALTWGPYHRHQLNQLQHTVLN